MGGPGGRPRSPRRRRHGSPPRAPLRRPHPPRRGLPLPVLQQLPGPAASVAPGRRCPARGCRRPPPRFAGATTGWSGDAVLLDVEAFLAARGPAVAFVRDLLSATAARPAQLGCFGLHEWAMVHGIPADDVRHAGWPLRLGQRRHRRGGRAARHPLLALRRLPLLHPSRRGRATRCGPPGRARWRWSSPAACTPGWTSTSGRSSSPRWCRASWWPTRSSWPGRSGCSTCRPRPTTCASSATRPCAIETPEGKAAYLERQRAFAERSNALRHRLLAVLDAATAGLPAGG